MKSLVALASIIIAMTALPASAQQGGGLSSPGGPGGQRGRGDCSQAADPTACAAHREARQKAAEACKGKAGPERKQCMTRANAERRLQQGAQSRAMCGTQAGLRPVQRPAGAGLQSSACSRRCRRQTAARPLTRHAANSIRRRARRARIKLAPSTAVACATSSPRPSRQAAPHSTASGGVFDERDSTNRVQQARDHDTSPGEQGMSGIHDFSATTLDGREQSLADYKGRSSSSSTPPVSAVSHRSTRDWKNFTRNTARAASSFSASPTTSSVRRNPATRRKSPVSARSPTTSASRCSPKSM